MVGTYLNTLLAEAKNEILADVSYFNPEKKLITTTLTKPDEGFGELELAAQALKANDVVVINEVKLYDRDYQVLFSPSSSAKRTWAGWGRRFPVKYVTTTVATSRTTFSLIFTLGTAAVIVIGYLLSQSIARPILNCGRFPKKWQREISTKRLASNAMMKSVNWRLPLTK